MSSVHALAEQAPRHSPIRLFLIWFLIGTTSFGGGAATQLLIQQHFVKRRWMLPAEFAQAWAVVQFVPGVNQIAMAVLIGFRFGGWIGVAASVVGMMTPAVAITIAMTALYTRVAGAPLVTMALEGITPAIVALSLVFMWRLLLGPMTALRQQGGLAFAAGVAVLGAAAALGAGHVPVLACYLAGAIGLGVVYAMRLPKTIDRVTDETTS